LVVDADIDFHGGSFKKIVINSTQTGGHGRVGQGVRLSARALMPVFQG
jgi:hypothetical protein